MERKKILIIAEELLPLSSAQAARIHSFIKELAGHYQVEVLCGEQGKSNIDCDSRVKYYTIRRYSETSLFPFLWYLLKFNLKENNLLKRKQYSLVIITVPRYEITYGISKNKCTYLLDVRDIVEQENYRKYFEKFFPKRISNILAKKIEKRNKKKIKSLIENSILTTVAYKGIQDHLNFLYPEFSEKLAFVPNGVDLEYFPIVEREKERILRILYIGNFAEKDLLLPLIDDIKKTRDEIKFVFVGSSRNENKIRRKVTENNLENKVTFTGKLHHTKIYELAKQSDIGIIFRDRNLPTLLPVSLVEYMAMQLPVIVNDYAELGDFVRSTRSGFIIKEIHELADLLNTLIYKKNDLQKIGKRNRRWIVKHADRKIIANNFRENIIAKVLK